MEDDPVEGLARLARQSRGPRRSYWFPALIVVLLLLLAYALVS